MRLELLIFLLSCWLTVASFETVNQTNIKPWCQPKCGNVDIPYPFGIGVICSIADWANINCNNTFNPPRPFIGDLEVAEFSLTEVRIKNFIATSCYNKSGGLIQIIPSMINLGGTPYTFSSTKNKFTAIGCDTFVLANMDMGNYSSGCTSLCSRKEDLMEGSCSGIGCCEASIPKGLKQFYITPGTIYSYSKVFSFNSCGSAFLAETGKYKFDSRDFSNVTSLKDVPVVLNFAVGNETCKSAKQNNDTFACKGNSYCYDTADGGGYLCNCSKGYTGNPYLNWGGCRDVNECEDPNNNPCKGICTNTKGGYECSCPTDSYGDGTKNGTGCTKKTKDIPILQLSLGIGLGLLFLLLGSSLLYFSIRKRKFSKLKEKFFLQNGGLLFKQQISLYEGVENTKIFKLEELKVATNNYHADRILGQGGNGTVYKGVLPDLRVVAVKKSKVVSESQLGQFINEVVILTQINHRNVVKLLGCCLETQVPMLVYEFVSNGTLSHHLRERGGTASSISWGDRLRIAAETASALSYLHSAAAIPIIHRDVKSDNILLDENYTAKVADFGASRLNPLDETQISTLVQGTMGYLDPEYFQSGQLTEKSDVYSFGVVLAELLTGAKPICYERSIDQTNLAAHFIISIQENRLYDVLEPRIVNEGKREEVIAVAELAKRCLSIKAEQRPSMKSVAAELGGLRGFEKHSWLPKGDEERMSPTSEQGMDLYDVPSVTCSSDDVSLLYNLEDRNTKTETVPW